MTRQVPPTDPIRRHSWDQDPGPELPAWQIWAMGAAALLGVVVFVALVVWGIVELFRAMQGWS